MARKRRNLPTILRHFTNQFSDPSFLAPSPSAGTSAPSTGLTADGPVDPDLRGEFRGAGRARYEAVGAVGVGGGEHLLPAPDHLGRAAEVDLAGGEQPDAAVPVLGVVPREELAAEVLRLLDAAEAAGETGVVLDRLELRLSSTGCRSRSGDGLATA